MNEQAVVTSSPGMQMTARVYPVENGNNHLANASVTLGGCFAIKGIRIMSSEKGPFVAMPQRKTQDGEYKDICFPTTADMRKTLNDTVLGEYQKVMEQGHDGRDSVLGDLKGRSAEVKPPVAGKARSIGGDAR